MSDTPKFNATEMDIHSPFNACQHRGYCQSLLAELADARAELVERDAVRVHYEKRINELKDENDAYSKDAERYR